MKMLRPHVAMLVTLLAVCRSAVGQDQLPPSGAPAQPQAVPPAALDPVTYRQQISYILGLNTGGGFRADGIEIDPQSFLAGLTDALEGKPLKWSEEVLNAAGERFNQEMMQKRQQEQAQSQLAAERNAQAGQAYLEANRQKPDVQVTPSGLQYKVLQQGTGPSPVATDTVRCHYRGKLIDGTEFDSSYKRGEPAEFIVNRVIPGWTEALQKMKVGDKWELVVPADLGYGLQPPGPPIEPNSLLIFELELLDFAGQ